MAFPTVSLLDSFSRGAEEKPLSNGGKFTILNGMLTAGRVTTGASGGWGASSSFAAGEDGAYWNAAEFNNPGVSWKLAVVASTERIISIWCSVINPTTAKISGYKLEMEETSSGKCKLTLKRITEGSPTTLSTVTGVAVAVKDSIGISTNGAIVTVWHKVGEGSWTVVAEASDSSYNKGFVGLGMKGNLARVINLEAGSGAGHEHTLTTTTQVQSASLRHPALTRTLTRTQPQSPVVNRLSKGSFETSQTQSASVAYLRPHSQRTTQSQAVTYMHSASRVLTFMQGQGLRTTNPTAALLDAFARANENPVSNGGEWAKTGLAQKTGEVSGEKWKATSTFAAGEDSIYYTLAELPNPITIAELVTIKIANERSFSFYACLSNPGTSEITGYRMRMVQVIEAGGLKFTFVVEKIVKGVVVATLGELKELSFSNEPWKIAFTVQGGVLTIWRRVNNLEAFTAILEVRDNSFTTGFVGFGARGNVGTVDAFLASASPAVFLSKSPILRSFLIAQAQVAESPKGSKRLLTAAQAQVASLARKVAHAFALTQRQGYLFPTLAITETTNSKEALEANWTVQGWMSQRGKIESFAGKNERIVWESVTLRTVTGGRYNKASYIDPVNILYVRTTDETTEESVAANLAVGICASEAGERNGYVARITTGTNWIVTLERWVAGAKTVLGTVEIPKASFVAFTEFGIGLIDGIVRVFLRPQESRADFVVLLEVADPTFTTGWDTVDWVGTKWGITDFVGGTSDGSVYVKPSKSASLSTTQGQSATLARAPARILASTQSQSTSLRHSALSRALSVTQVQVSKLLRGVTRALNVSQGQGVQRLAALSRTLVYSQGQEATLEGGISGGRLLAAEQQQLPVLVRTPARLLTSAQVQVASIVRAVARLLALSQGQQAALSASLDRSLAVAQTQQPVVSKTPARTLGVAQTQTALAGREISRLLAIEQDQEVALSEEVKSGALSISQAQSVSITRDVARHLTVSQAQVVKHTIALSRSFVITQSEAATVSTGSTPVTLTVAQPQHVFRVESTIVPGESHEGEEEPGHHTPTTSIATVSMSLGVTEKARRRHIGLQGAPVQIKAPPRKKGTAS